MKNTPSNVWLHEVAMQFVQSTHPNTTWVGSRGTSKTHATAYRIWHMVPTMPRALGFMLSPTIKQLLTKELPTILGVWEKHGIVQYRSGKTILNPKCRYFTLGEPPPSTWKKPPAAPTTYKYALAFPNGFTMEIMGARAGESERGGSYDFCFVQEAGFISGTRYKQVYGPMVRGDARKKFSLGAGYPEIRSPFYLSRTVTTSQPTTEQGRWSSREMKRKAEEFPKEYMYLDSDIYANLPLYGAEKIEAIKRDICAESPIIWESEYLNLEYNRPANQYYPEFTEEKNTYLNISTPYGQKDPFYATDQPIYVSFDFNSYFMCATIHQKNDDYIVTIGEAYGDFQNANIDYVIDEICYLLPNHQNKTMLIYGDSTKDPNNPKIYEDIKRLFQKKGWSVYIKVKAGFNPPHYLRKKLIAEAHKGDLPLQIKINADQCPYLINSIKMSPVLPDFRKDKSSEKRPDIVDPKKATHLGDTADYVWVPLLEAAGKKTHRSTTPLSTL